MANATISGTVITRQDRTFTDQTSGETVPLFDVVIYDDQVDEFYIYRSQTRDDVAGPQFESGATVEDLEVRFDKTGGVRASVVKNVRASGGNRF